MKIHFFCLLSKNDLKILRFRKQHMFNTELCSLMLSVLGESCVSWLHTYCILGESETQPAQASQERRTDWTPSIPRLD